MMGSKGYMRCLLDYDKYHPQGDDLLLPIMALASVFMFCLKPYADGG